MPTSLELQKIREQKADRAKKIVADAELANEGRGRELTPEEETEADGLIKEVEELGPKVERLRKIEGFSQSQGARQTPPPDPQNPNNQPKKSAREFAMPKRRSNLKNFKGPDADKKAYRLGMWALACRGHIDCLRWCRDHELMPILVDEHGQELRIHQEKVNTQGGYLVPQEVDDDIIDLRESFGVFRQWARMSPMSRDTKSRNRRNAGLTAAFVGEAVAGTESTKSWNQVSLTAKKLAVLCTITNELNEDAAIDLGDDLAGEIGFAFAQKEDDCGFNGDGTSTFGGIVGVKNRFENLSVTKTNIAGLVIQGTGNTWGAIVMADFTNMLGRLPRFAQTPDTAWFVHNAFWATVMYPLLLAAGGNTVNDLQGSTAPNFLGYPVRISQVMQSTTAVQTISAYLGSLKLAADFGDRRQTTIQFSDSATVGGVSVFETDEVAVRGTERFDINVHSVGNADAVAANRVPGPIVALRTGT